MECRRCGNRDPEMFYKGERGLYCRRCAMFKRILLNEEAEADDYEISKESGEFSFDYELTSFQKKTSAKVLEEILKGNDVLLDCVTGAGKTEISVETISHFLKEGKKVCYSIARKEVVIELSKRFEKIFPKAEVTALYGGHHEKLTGDLIICTTHQLFRYYGTFDLLVIDEADAFPLDGNEMLMNIAVNSCRGNIIFSTATLSPFLMEVLRKRKYVRESLLIRPSLKPMKVPKVIYAPVFAILPVLWGLIGNTEGQIIVFTDRKRSAILLYRFFSLFLNCTYVYSDLDEREKNIADFKNGKYRVIFSTTVLERGVTIRGVSVIILFPRKDSFRESAVTQMAGRVGRGTGDVSGEAYIITAHRSDEITRSLNSLKEANRVCEMSVLQK